MGADKAFLHCGDQTLLERMLALVQSVTKDVYIVGEASKFGSFAPTIGDAYRDHGPLGGIHAALRASQAELNLIVAVDLPFLTTALLNYLLDRAKHSGAVVTVPRISGCLQPLCAVYRRKFAGVAEKSLKEERNKIDPLFSNVSTCVIEQQDLAAAGVGKEMFRNLNTREDLEEAKRALGFGNQS